MTGITPCPYCGGEVEVIKLCKKKGKEKKDPYRIECRKCRALVARGFGFPDEPEAQSKLRLKEYDEYMHRYLYGEEKEHDT